MRQVVKDLQTIQNILLSHDLDTFDTMNDMHKIRRYVSDLGGLLDVLILKKKLIKRKEEK
jgi:hypothetical protein